MILMLRLFFFLGMHKSMAACAQGDEIMLSVVSELAPRVDVMNVEFTRTPAALAAPAVPLQYLLAQLFIGLGVKPKPRPSWKEAGHAALHMC